jgi:O-acetyl-ADP-ribose deacetylase (regulator of RNase III)
VTPHIPGRAAAGMVFGFLGRSAAIAHDSAPRSGSHREQVKRPIEIGDAVATGAGRLEARWVIHGAVMGQDLRTNAEAIARTTRRCLEVADGLGARSLALPAFGTGVGGFPLGECARLMVDVARAYEPRSLERVLFAVFGAEARRAFEQALAAESQ